MIEIIEVYSLYLDPLKKFKRLSRLSDNSSESVGDHSWSACVLALILGDQLNWGECITSRVVRHLLLHDIPEAYAGDIPSTLSAKYPKIKELKDDVELKVITGISNDYIKGLLLDLFTGEEDKDIIDKVHLCDKLDWMFQQLAVMDRVYIPKFLKSQSDKIIDQAALEGLDISGVYKFIRKCNKRDVDYSDVKGEV